VALTMNKSQSGRRHISRGRRSAGIGHNSAAQTAAGKHLDEAEGTRRGATAARPCE
jgi:hypothetical protein